MAPVSKRSGYGPTSSADFLGPFVDAAIRPRSSEANGYVGVGIQPQNTGANVWYARRARKPPA